jgi:uncharacterized protein
MKEPFNYKPFQFFLVAILITWASWLIAAYFSYRSGNEANRLVSIFELAGLFGPFVASLLLIFTSDSKELIQNYFNRLFNLNLIKLFSLPTIFLAFPLIMVVSVVISHLFFGRSLDQLAFAKAANFKAGLLPIPVMLFGAALFEELGWKGYGVDSLRGKRTFFKATLIYAALWACWHLPLFAINGYYHNLILRANPLFALNFLISVFPVAFIGNWLWYKNKGSILTVAIFHASCNFQGVFHIGQASECIETIILIIVAMSIVGLDRKIFQEEFPLQIGYYG